MPIVQVQQIANIAGMDSGYILEAKRDPARPDTLTLHYPSREYALAAAAIIQSQGSLVTVTGPDGALVFQGDPDAI